MKKIDRLVTRYPEETFLKADGFDNAILGVDENVPRLVYSVSRTIKILSKQMSEEEAIEYFYFNVVGAYVGEKTPLWVFD